MSEPCAPWWCCMEWCEASTEASSEMGRSGRRGDVNDVRRL